MATVSSSSAHTHERKSGGVGWLLRHPVCIGGVVVGIVFYALTAGFFSEAVPQLIGLPGPAVLGGFIWIAVCMALMLESCRNPASRT